ncbi:hypothetical protein D3C87_1637660 [compost metagenome]
MPPPLAPAAAAAVTAVPAPAATDAPAFAAPEATDAITEPSSAALTTALRAHTRNPCAVSRK